MRCFWFFTAVLYCLVGAGFADQSSLDPKVFHTNAKFSVDTDAMSLSSVVAAIEPRRGAPGYSWVRIYFYSFPLTAEDIAGARNGDVEALNKKALNSENRSHSNATIQFSVDQQFKVWQVDMSVLGHSCTIAPLADDVKKFLQTYQFDGKNIRLISKGSYVCDMKFMGIADQKFGWDVEVNLPVFEKTGK